MDAHGYHDLNGNWHPLGICSVDCELHNHHVAGAPRQALADAFFAAMRDREQAGQPLDADDVVIVITEAGDAWRGVCDGAGPGWASIDVQFPPPAPASQPETSAIVDSVPGAREKYESLLAARAAAGQGGPRFDVLLPAHVLTQMWYEMRRHLQFVLGLLTDVTQEAVSRELRAAPRVPVEHVAVVPPPEMEPFIARLAERADAIRGGPTSESETAAILADPDAMAAIVEAEAETGTVTPGLRDAADDAWLYKVTTAHTCQIRAAHTPHGLCPGTAPEFPSERIVEPDPEGWAFE